MIEELSAPRRPDEFTRSGSSPKLLILFLLLAAALGTRFFLLRNSGAAREVIAYCAQDQVYAEEIFHAFTAQTGIKVRPVFDSEAVKTVGLANRLLAERAHPRCDVFWGNEEMRTRELAEQGVFRSTNGWKAFGRRSRRVVINTNSAARVPSIVSLIELTNAAWRGKAALAYPQFGTTAVHLHALRQYWGEPAWERWCAALAENRPLLLEGNSAVVKAVARGDAWVGLTDSDDIAAGQADGMPVAALAPTPETLLIPNTVAVIRSAPHPEAADKLYAFLQSDETVKRLIAANAMEPDASSPPGGGLRVDWERLLRDLPETTARLNHYFLR